MYFLLWNFIWPAPSAYSGSSSDGVLRWRRVRCQRVGWDGGCQDNSVDLSLPPPSLSRSLSPPLPSHLIYTYGVDAYPMYPNRARGIHGLLDVRSAGYGVIAGLRATNFRGRRGGAAGREAGGTPTNQAKRERMKSRW